MLRFISMIVLLVLMFGLYDEFAHGGTKMRSLAVGIGLNAQAEGAVPVEAGSDAAAGDYSVNTLN